MVRRRRSVASSPFVVVLVAGAILWLFLHLPSAIEEVSELWPSSSLAIYRQRTLDCRSIAYGATGHAVIDATAQALTRRWIRHPNCARSKRRRTLRWTVVGDPTVMVIEAFGFAAATGQFAPTEAAWQRFVQQYSSTTTSIPREVDPSWLVDNPQKGHYQKPIVEKQAGAIAFTYRSGTRPRPRRFLPMSDYDFVLVEDQWERSLAVASFLWGLDLRQVLHLARVTSGSFFDHHGVCVFWWPPRITSSMQTWLETAPIMQHAKVDYRRAQERLASTAAFLGEAKVEARQHRWRVVQRLVESDCGRSCESSGRYHESDDDYCLDRVADAFDNQW